VFHQYPENKTQRLNIRVYCGRNNNFFVALYILNKNSLDLKKSWYLEQCNRLHNICPNRGSNNTPGSTVCHAYCRVLYEIESGTFIHLSKTFKVRIF
jgi:hypothetical protein